MGRGARISPPPSPNIPMPSECVSSLLLHAQVAHHLPQSLRPRVRAASSCHRKRCPPQIFQLPRHDKRALQGSLHLATTCNPCHVPALAPHRMDDARTMGADCGPRLGPRYSPSPSPNIPMPSECVSSLLLHSQVAHHLPQSLRLRVRACRSPRCDPCECDY